MTDTIVDGLAVARLTRLVTKDTVADVFRETWIVLAYEEAGRPIEERRDPTDVVTLDPDPPKMATFITCPWCTSFWIAGLVIAARRFAPRLWSPIARALAFSHVAGLGANLDVD